MTNDDIARIQEATGITLPQHYVDVVTNYPAELINTEAPDFGLFDDPKQIIEENHSVRKNGYFGEKWPDHYFIIGHNGCGDYYVIITDSTRFTVGFADHEIMACNDFADGLQDFIQKLLQEMGKEEV